MPTTPPPITPAPPAPIRHEKATFSDRVDAFVTWLVAVVAQFAALALNVFNNAVEAFQSAVAASNWAGLASDKAAAAALSESGAAQSVLAAAAINSATMWASGTTYQQYQAAISKVTLRTYRKTTTAAANTGGIVDPANDPANWQAVGPAMSRSGRTANATLIARDMGIFAEITAGTFTQTFDTPANLGANWYCYLKNSGSGDVTIPASDGVTNWIMYPGEARLFQCDGITIRSTVIQPFYRAHITTELWKKPPGYKCYGIEMWNGGQGGRGGEGIDGSYIGAGGFGGIGSFAGHFIVADSDVPASLTITVGAGSPGTNGGTNISMPAGEGGISSFGSLISLTSSNAASIYKAGDGGKGFSNSGQIPATPGVDSNLAGDGGAGGTTARANGANGIAPGGGGGGGGGSDTAGLAGGKGGDGARGEVRVRGIA